MATRQPAVAVDHLTVVPENYHADDGDDDESGNRDVSGDDAEFRLGRDCRHR